IHLIQKKPYLFMVAAVADYTPKFPQVGKIKKSDIGESWDIKLKQTEDIITNINKDNLTTVSFKAEMNENSGLENAKNSLTTKGVDAVCYNFLKDSQSFGTDQNSITFINQQESIELGTADKLDLAFKILEESKKLNNKI
ncbi:MAG: bifunctional phosphopantothenoylcysteine decarboxylase/phosphopantothenate--cysteine ligase CoaBC, partial [Sulfurovaceae bacterium]|nr:bifunctional phosphopantothenoylcysteine decarboxylase/phosphopantothenate--cysteine ligase CoaBC [Sulfurovaceae bacterium]